MTENSNPSASGYNTLATVRIAVDKPPSYRPWHACSSAARPRNNAAPASSSLALWQHCILLPAKHSKTPIIRPSRPTLGLCVLFFNQVYCCSPTMSFCFLKTRDPHPPCKHRPSSRAGPPPQTTRQTSTLFSTRPCQSPISTTTAPGIGRAPRPPPALPRLPPRPVDP